MTTFHGTTEVPDLMREPCHEFVPPEDERRWLELGAYGLEADDAPPSGPRQRVAWGFASGSIERVLVTLTDGEGEAAVLASAEPAIDATLWAIGYEDVEVQGATASTPTGSMGFFIHHRSVPPLVYLVGMLVSLGALVGGLRALRRRRRWTGRGRGSTG